MGSTRARRAARHKLAAHDRGINRHSKSVSYLRVPTRFNRHDPDRQGSWKAGGGGSRTRHSQRDIDRSLSYTIADVWPTKATP